MAKITAVIGNITPDTDDGEELFDVELSISVDKKTLTKLLNKSDFHNVELELK